MSRQKFFAGDTVMNRKHIYLVGTIEETDYSQGAHSYMVRWSGYPGPDYICWEHQDDLLPKLINSTRRAK